MRRMKLSYSVTTYDAHELVHFQVICYDFLGMPAPSLGMIMKMCVAMETWLGDHEDNVVVVHCLVRVSV